MSEGNANDNLREFGNELSLGDLVFDENKTCILGIDNAFSLHLTYEPRSDRLYLYAPVLDGLPTNDQIRMKLYEALLTGSMLGGRMAGGGVGVAANEGLILMHCVLEMGLGTDSKALCRFAPLFVQAVEEWRKIAEDIVAGKDVKVELVPNAAIGGGTPGGGGLPQGYRPTNPSTFVKV